MIYQPWGKNKSAILIACCLAFICFLLGCTQQAPSPECSDPLGCLEIAPGEEIHIGVIQALSGKVAALGTEQIRGIELALAARGNQLAGHGIQVRTEDTGCASEGGTNAALKILADPKTAAVIGTTCSVAAASASKVISEAGLVMVSGNNSAPFLTSIGGKQAPDFQKGFFRTAANEENAGKAAAIYAFSRLGLKTAATINDGDIYTTGLTRGFKTAFEDLGGKIVLSATVNKGDTDMLPVLTAVEYTRAQILFFPLFQPEGNHILFGVRQIPELAELVLMSDGALIEASFIDAVRDKGTGMYFVGPAKPETAAAKDLEEEYTAKFKARPRTHYFMNAYDAASILFSAMESVLAARADGSLSLGRSALRKALSNTRDFPGVTGILNCDPFGDCAFPKFNVLRLDDPAKGVEGLQSNIVFKYPGE